MNHLYYGDNSEILKKYIADETAELCYIDPPFNSKRTYSQIYNLTLRKTPPPSPSPERRGESQTSPPALPGKGDGGLGRSYNNIGKEDKAQAQAFTDTWTWDDRANEGFDAIIQNSDKLMTTQMIELMIGLSKVLGRGSLLAYLVSMTQRIAQIWRVLKPTGSLYLHCDPTCSHYLKLVLDALFCSRGGEFRNEIIWSYRRWPAKQKNFQKMHDIILRYAKSEKVIWNQQYEELAPTTLKADKGKRILNVFDPHTGKRIRGEKTGEASPGAPMRDVWEIGIISPTGKERLGYPTQKPEALLERIIKAGSNEGDLVLYQFAFNTQ